MNIKTGCRGASVRSLQERLKSTGFDPGRADGIFGEKTAEAVRKFQAANGLAVDARAGQKTQAALAAARQRDSFEPATPTPAATTVSPTATTGGLGFTPNPEALAAAKKTGAGQNVDRAVEQNASLYNKAADLTGVPARYIAAIHANEGAGGTSHKKPGPESGFGIDPKFHSTAEGQAILDKHGLGKWDRGGTSDKAKLQAAVIAAEIFKGSAKQAGVTVSDHMNQKEIATAITAYATGPRSRATQQAARTGRSWIFDPSDKNPHPFHPGGTSARANGQRITVPPGRKNGLLRWDTMVALTDAALKKHAARTQTRAAA